MDKKTIALVIVVCAVVFSIGIFAGRFIMPTEIPVPTPTPISTPLPTPIPRAPLSPEITPTPMPQINEERDLIKQWLQMYGQYDPELDEDDVDEIMYYLQRSDLHPVKIYRGSLIFYEKDCGYCYILDIDDDLRQMPPDMTFTKYANLAKKKGGTIAIIYVFDENMACACFQTLSSAESFLAEFWSIS